MNGTSRAVSVPAVARIEATNIEMAFSTNGQAPATRVLDGISFSVPEGSFTSVVGPSGCGKTTLVRILAGLLIPTHGQVRVDGQPIAGPSPQRTVIFQDYGLFEWKTVFENVEFGLKAKGLPKEQRRQIAKQYIEMVHLTGAEHKYPNELSGGMKQRAAVARALAVEPECVLMDEPFAALDSQTRRLVLEEVLEVWEKTRKTILLITHNVEEALFLSDRVLVLSKLPARIILDLPVDLPRPRSSDLRSDLVFRAMADRLWQTLRTQVGTTKSGLATTF